MVQGKPSAKTIELCEGLPASTREALFYVHAET
jgi:hypothetical protein